MSESVDMCAHGCPKLILRIILYHSSNLFTESGLFIKLRSHNMDSNVSLLALETLSPSSEAVITGGPGPTQHLHGYWGFNLYPLHLGVKHLNP